MIKALAVCLISLGFAHGSGHGELAKKGPADPGPCDETCQAKLPALSHIDQAFLTTARNAVIGTLYNDVEKNKEFAACKQTMMCHTMLTPTTLKNFAEATQYVIANKIEGDILELGVWRGGGDMFVKALLDTYEKGSSRNVHLFDVFDTMSLYPPISKWQNVFGSNPLNSVKAVSSGFEKMGLLDDHVKFHVGLFENTAAKFRQEATPDTKIAVLRIDGNHYYSYQDAMYNLYDFVPVGGIVIFDDVYDHPVVADFWNHFRKDYGMAEKLQRVVGIGDGAGGTGWFRREKHFLTDRKKMRKPSDSSKDNAKGSGGLAGLFRRGSS